MAGNGSAQDEVLHRVGWLGTDELSTDALHEGRDAAAPQPSDVLQPRPAVRPQMVRSSSPLAAHTNCHKI